MNARGFKTKRSKAKALKALRRGVVRRKRLSRNRRADGQETGLFEKRAYLELSKLSASSGVMSSSASNSAWAAGSTRNSGRRRCSSASLAGSWATSSRADRSLDMSASSGSRLSTAVSSDVSSTSENPSSFSTYGRAGCSTTGSSLSGSGLCSSTTTRESTNQ